MEFLILSLKYTKMAASDGAIVVPELARYPVIFYSFVEIKNYIPLTPIPRQQALKLMEMAR
jgi:hypothetical protein